MSNYFQNEDGSLTTPSIVMMVVSAVVLVIAVLVFVFRKELMPYQADLTRNYYDDSSWFAEQAMKQGNPELAETIMQHAKTS